MALGEEANEPHRSSGHDATCCSHDGVGVNLEVAVKLGNCTRLTKMLDTERNHSLACH